MSRTYYNYSQYLGANRCCNINTRGQQGEIGPTGPASVGIQGYTGPTGSSVSLPSGTNWGDYLYWNNITSTYDVGDTNINIGGNAGQTNQGTNAVAIGYLAGNNSQGTNSIAIGSFAGQTNQPASSIIINASGSALNGADSSACYINPLRSLAATNAVYYNSTTFELSYLTSSATTKNTIQDLTDDTSVIYNLQPKTYIYNSDPDAGVQYGLIAEEAMITHSKFATYDLNENNINRKPVAINYDTIQIFMLAEMKKKNEEMNAMKEEMNAMKEELKILKTSLSSISTTDISSITNDLRVNGSIITANCVLDGALPGQSGSSISLGYSYLRYIIRDSVGSPSNYILPIGYDGATITFINQRSSDFSIQADPTDYLYNSYTNSTSRTLGGAYTFRASTSNTKPFVAGKIELHYSTILNGASSSCGWIICWTPIHLYGTTY